MNLKFFCNYAVNRSPLKAIQNRKFEDSNYIPQLYFPAILKFEKLRSIIH
jgi:hypothetical protein